MIMSSSEFKGHFTVQNPVITPVNLALQGGGAYGAYTWGVLDGFLSDPHFDIDALSGSSAGALNAIALSIGYIENNAQGARDKLRLIWEEIAAGENRMWDTAQKAFNAWAWGRVHHPLDDLIARHLDFDLLRRQQPFGIALGVTRVRDGKGFVFQNDQITPSVLRASTFLPLWGNGVDLFGDYYWDGAFSKNPPLRCFNDISNTRKTVLIQIENGGRNWVKSAEQRGLILDVVSGCDDLAGFNLNDQFWPQRSVLEDLFTKGQQAASAYLQKRANGAVFQPC